MCYQMNVFFLFLLIIYIISSKTKRTFCLWLHPLLSINEKQNTKLILTNSDLTKCSFYTQVFVDKSYIMIHGSDICLQQGQLQEAVAVFGLRHLTANI